MDGSPVEVILLQVAHGNDLVCFVCLHSHCSSVNACSLLFDLLRGTHLSICDMQ